VALGLFFEVGSQMTVTGWYPTYSVLTNRFTVEQAPYCTTIFWSAMTVFRFIAAFSSVKTSQKLGILIKAFLVFSIIAFFLDLFDFYTLTTIVGSLGFGVSISAIFSLMLALPA
jgi:fucose permease